MNIELKEVPIRDIVLGYTNDSEEGVFGYNGKLNIRPKYQREFVYKDKQRDAVIETVKKDFPLNVLYWVKNEDDTYEVLDGQQRTISICEYVNGKFSLNFQYFHNLEQEEKDQILNYKLMVYFCEGTNREKLDWFKTINIAGEKLTDQELRNAIYTGTWLNDAKKYFSKTNCPAWNIGKNYVKGSPIRQDFLETVLDWISGGNITEYMAQHQHNEDANDLWQYFQNVINWIKIIFPDYRKEMKGVNWGKLYNGYKDNTYNSTELNSKVIKMMRDDDVTKKSGIYVYLVTNELKYLNIRSFTKNQKREKFEEQGGICAICGNTFELNEMEADHITPWIEGGKTDNHNCQMLCKSCNRKKSSN